MQITWFRHNHEARNDYFRYALMKRHLEGDLAYREVPQEKGHDFRVPDSLVRHNHRHTSFFLAEDGSQSRLIAIDNEDSFVHMQPFIEEVDAYFCCPFTTAFHREKKFPPLLPWQTEGDVKRYRTKASELIEKYGEHFGKVRKLTPTPTTLADFGKMPRPKWREAVWKHRFRRLQFWKRDRELWRHDYAACEARYEQMLGYRELSLRYDVVCRESLWGWPDNRIELHKRLDDLKTNGYEVYSQLTPASEEETVPSRFEVTEENRKRLDELMQPMDLGDPYETALGRSRLAVFPTGFHWGWRGIMFLGLCAGLPILMDRPLYEPYFDFDEFDVAYNEGTWGKLLQLVNEIDEDRWMTVKSQNQRVFDENLSPEGVGLYLQSELKKTLGNEVNEQSKGTKNLA